MSYHPSSPQSRFPARFSRTSQSRKFNSQARRSLSTASVHGRPEGRGKGKRMQFDQVSLSRYNAPELVPVNLTAIPRAPGRLFVSVKRDRRQYRVSDGSKRQRHSPVGISCRFRPDSGDQSLLERAWTTLGRCLYPSGAREWSVGERERADHGAPSEASTDLFHLDRSQPCSEPTSCSTATCLSPAGSLGQGRLTRIITCECALPARTRSFWCHTRAHETTALEQWQRGKWTQRLAAHLTETSKPG